MEKDQRRIGWRDYLIGRLLKIQEETEEAGPEEFQRGVNELLNPLYPAEIQMMLLLIKRRGDLFLQQDPQRDNPFYKILDLLGVSWGKE